MSKYGLKLLIVGLAVLGGALVFGSGQSSALTPASNNCPGAPKLHPSGNWGTNAGAHNGARAAAVVSASVAGSPNKRLNVKYNLKSDMPGTTDPDLDKRIFQWPVGNGRSSFKQFRTGERIYGNGGDQCNGWSVIGAGIDGYNGNGYVLDCGIGFTKANFWIDQIENPNGESGKWEMYYGKDLITDNVNGAEYNKKIFNVSNGQTVVIYLYWHPDTTFSLNAGSDVNKTSAEPGQKATFTHWVYNNGPARADYYWRVQQKKNNGSWTTVADNSVSDAGKGTMHPDPNDRKFKITIPDNASNGDKWCQRIAYTNKNGLGTYQWAGDNYARTDEKCVTVSKPPVPDTGDTQEKCRYLYVQTPANFKGPSGNKRKVRALVKVQDVQVTSYRDKKTANASNPYGIEYDANYNNIPADNSGQYFATVGTGDKNNTQTSFLWKYQPTKKNIKVWVTYQYDKDDNGTWLDAPGLATSGFTTIPCVSATCSVSVVGTGPGGRVLAGETASITATITNTGPSAQEARIFDASFTYGGRQSDGTGIIPPGKTGDALLDDVPVANSLTANGGRFKGSFNVTDTKISDLSVPCAFDKPVYRYFEILPTATAEFNDSEAPTSFAYSGGASLDKNVPDDIKVGWTGCVYKATAKRESGLCASPIILSGSGTGAFKSTVAKTVFGPSSTGVSSPVSAGDKYCTVIDLQYTSGYIDKDGNVVNGEKSDDSTDNRCDVIANKPYFKVFGSGVRSGGTFKNDAGTCPATDATDGIIAGWNKRGSASVNNVGAGAELTAVAKNKITAFASAQPSFAIFRSPTELTFANSGKDSNNNTVDVTSGMGGSYGADYCFSDINPPTNATNVSSATATVSTATLPAAPGMAYKYNSNGTQLTIDTTNISPNVNVSYFVNGDVYIKGNIAYASGWTRDTVPSFILKASGNIYIDPSVTRLDGIYVAEGQIYTCATDFNELPDPDDALYGTCNTQLVVHGVFQANKINLMRTYKSLRNATQTEYRKPEGATAPDTNAAEVFDFSPELYLSNPMILPKSGTGVQQWESYKNLPPVL
ncbi:MAG: hypothetical protein U0524_03140 [Candidatus Saccharimonadales bacterium]